ENDDQRRSVYRIGNGTGVVVAGPNVAGRHPARETIGLQVLPHELGGAEIRCRVRDEDAPFHAVILLSAGVGKASWWTAGVGITGVVTSSLGRLWCRAGRFRRRFDLSIVRCRARLSDRPTRRTRSE